MGNYFSQLAKQSGIRFAGRSGKARQSETLSVAPFHQEKTVLVEPNSQPAVKSSESTRQNALPQFSEAEKSTSKQTQTVTAEISAPKKINHFSDNSLPENVEQDQSEDLRETQSFAPFEAISSNLPQTISETIVDISESKNALLPTNRKKYFKQTSEILEKGAENLQEIEEILFREVQEWVAGGTESEIIKAKELSVQILPPSEPENVFAKSQDAQKDLEEQNFNLSIGTISIVIEESEKALPTENVAPKFSAESPKGETKRQFSRLSRNYL